MKHLKNTGALLLLIVFLVGSNGISFLHHFCSGSNTSSTIVFPGVFKEATSCCEDVISFAVLGDLSPSSANLDPVPCCKSSLVYYRLMVTSTRADQVILHLPAGPVFLFASIDQPSPEAMDIPGTNAFFEFHSPPLFGRSLITYLHQIKIPLPVSFA